MKKVIIDEKTGRKRVYTENKTPSKTDPSWSPHCDVNNIMAQFHKTGQITHLAKKQGQFADVTNCKDLLQSHIIIKQAETDFMSQPAAVRARFHNNMYEMLQFLEDPANNEEAIKLGLKTLVESPDSEQGGPKTSAANKGEARVSPKGEPIGKNTKSDSDSD
jgi:phage internal scaffolding protein